MTGSGSVSFPYYAQDSDCGKVVTFTAVAGDCVSASASLMVVKAEYDDFDATGFNARFVSDEEAKGSMRWFAGSVVIMAKVKLTPKPQACPYEFEMLHMVNGVVAKMTPKRGQVIGGDPKVGPDGNILREQLYNPLTGVVELRGDDHPGKSWPSDYWRGIATVEGKMNAWVYLRIACKDLPDSRGSTGGGTFRTIGKVEWKLVSSLRACHAL